MTNKIKDINAQIIFFAEADYHIRNAAMVIRILETYGINCIIFDSCVNGRRLNDDERKLYNDINIIKVSDFNNILKVVNLHALRIVVSYSFGSSKTRDVLQEITYKGIITASVVEGVWDYLELILGINQLTPYRNCDYTFLAGLADTLYFEDRLEKCYIGGLASVRSLLNKKVSFPRKPLAVINVNFSYGQAEFGRNLFLETAIKGCKKAGVDYIISQHPHDISEIRGKYDVSEESMYHLIEEGSVFISRFANGIFEALAMGKPVIYHNPHQEKAINFQDSMGAYQKSQDIDSLCEALTSELSNIRKGVDFRNRACGFLQYHTNIFDKHSPEKNISKGLLDIIEKNYNSDSKKHFDIKPSILRDENVTGIKHSPILLSLFEEHRQNRKSPKVSLIIAVYNVGSYLRKCLDSAVKQTFLLHDYEIIIVNDASTDGSLTIIQEYQSQYSNITLVDKPINEGLGMARNYGLKAAKGDYVFFLDGDDFISAMTLDRLYTEAKLNDADLVPCSHVKVSLENGYEILSRRTDLNKISHNKLERVKSILMHKHSSVSWGILIRRELFIDFNIIYLKGYHEHLLFCLKLFTYAKTIFIVDEPFYNYVQRPLSILGHISKDHIHDLLEAEKQRSTFINNYFGQETASRHFERHQIIQRGLMKMANFLIRSIRQKEVDLDIRKDLYLFLFDSVRNVDFMVNSSFASGEKLLFDDFLKLSEMLNIKNISINEQIKRFEVLSHFVFINCETISFHDENNVTLCLPKKESYAYYFSNEFVESGDKITAEINLFSLNVPKGLEISLERHGKENPYEGTKQEVKQAQNHFSINHTFKNKQSGYRLFFKNKNDEDLIVKISIPKFFNRRDAINCFKEKFSAWIRKICTVEPRMNQIFTDTLIQQICGDYQLLMKIYKDYKIRQEVENNSILNKLCDEDILDKICSDTQIFKALCDYNLINGIRNSADLIDEICSDEVRDMIFGHKYNSLSRSDKFYGFFGKLIGAYEIHIVVKKWVKIDKPKLESLKDKHRGKRAFVICNGPSLNQIDFSKLKNEITIGTNGIFLSFEETGFKPTYYVVEDDLVAEDRKDGINNINGPVKFYAQRLAYCLERKDGAIYLNHSSNFYPWNKEKEKMNLDMHFSHDISVTSYGGHTVTYTCLQIAYHLGIRELYIIGADHDYVVPDRYNGRNANENYVISSEEVDVNHFNPTYFGKGYRWHNPKVHKLEQAYQNARKFYEYNGGNIYNATNGGCLEVFDRVNFCELFEEYKVNRLPTTNEIQHTDNRSFRTKTKSTDEGIPSYSEALALFRRGEYLTALGISQQLQQLRPDFRWYGELSKACELKLGGSEV